MDDRPTQTSHLLEDGALSVHASRGENPRGVFHRGEGHRIPHWVTIPPRSTTTAPLPRTSCGNRLSLSLSVSLSLSLCLSVSLHCWPSRRGLASFYYSARPSSSYTLTSVVMVVPCLLYTSPSPRD